MRILSVVGTRPNFVKAAALYREVKSRGRHETFLVHTGQHYDSNMSEVFFEELGLPEPDMYLDVSGGSNTSQTSLIMQRFEPVLLEVRPDVVVVLGDVNSTLAASLVAVQCDFPLAHVEAGLRSGDRTMPEEINRIVVDHISDFLFVTERSGVDNLRREGVPDGRVFLVGNVMVDTLTENMEKAGKSDVLNRLELRAGEYVLATIHRASTADDEDALREILGALVEIAHGTTVVFPVHPRTRKRIGEFGLASLLEKEPNLLATAPLGYLDFLFAMSRARAVLTDSGGIQSETTILGVPCVTMRENTELRATLENGTNTLAGTRREDILRAFESSVEVPPRSFERPPLWDGKAAGRILDVLERFFE